MNSRLSLLLVLVICLSVCSVSLSQNVTYTVTDLGNLGFDAEAYCEENCWWVNPNACACGINNDGVVTGYG